ncbi:hypothetical protein DYB37_006060 [Aphanomyces astaci]|uniref:SAM domain-containing protein n=1 Tax=Aphanomyces astaci TaxID=112090 RepID=A0A418F3Q3_APHAT|nr:hypothetical protein DYB37_006060 [Aphanomyces astaci]
MGPADASKVNDDDDLLDAGSPTGTLRWTPLQYACAAGDIAVATTLLENDNNLVHQVGQCAHAAGFDEIAALLGPSTPSTASPSDSGVRDWLASIGLGQYAHAFVQAGFDDVNFLHENGLTTEDVVALGVVKRGHQLKLKRLYQIDRFIHKPDDDTDSHYTSSDNSSEDDSSEGDDDE